MPPAAAAESALLASRSLSQQRLVVQSQQLEASALITTKAAAAANSRRQEQLPASERSSPLSIGLAEAAEVHPVEQAHAQDLTPAAAPVQLGRNPAGKGGSQQGPAVASAGQGASSRWVRFVQPPPSQVLALCCQKPLPHVHRCWCMARHRGMPWLKPGWTYISCMHLGQGSQGMEQRITASDLLLSMHTPNRLQATLSLMKTAPPHALSGHPCRITMQPHQMAELQPE